MTDYHLYDFMRCPHKFYFRHIKRREPSSFEWQQIAQMIVNQIINEYYTLPVLTNENCTFNINRKVLEKSKNQYVCFKGGVLYCFSEAN